MTAAEIELLHRYLDDRLSAADALALPALLRDSPEARRTLRDLATVDAKLSELAAQAPAAVSLAAARASQPRQSRLFAWRSLAELALGLLIGAVFSSMAWAYAVPTWLTGGAPISLVAESYETGYSSEAGGLPLAPDRWSGDRTEVTGPLLEVRPSSGTKMLRILRADYPGKPNAAESYTGDLYRLVDLRPFRQQLAGNSAVVELSAAFNAAPFPESEEYRSALAMHALTADLAATPESLSGSMLADGSLAMARQVCPRLDRDPATWQRLEAALKLPAETEFLLVHLGVSHIPKFQRRATFPGHFLDDVRLTLRQQP
ncbi:MAG: hypothetical protein SFU86_12220 [Pirellulaceae bacterium]|nr:hypothetical protein [Pirellulaceae bacterium]